MKRMANALLIAGFLWSQPCMCRAVARGSPSLHDLYDLSKAEREKLTSAALAGNVPAALALSNYYAEHDLRLREKFLRLAANSGSVRASITLVRFYVEPRGMFRPEEALAIRRELRKQLLHPLKADDGTWMYQASIDYKYMRGIDAKKRRRRLLGLAIELGSKRARAELAELPYERRSQIEISKVPWPQPRAGKTK